MTHFQMRRAELLGGRKRRPKTGDRAARLRHEAVVAQRVRAERARAAANRLARVIAWGVSTTLIFDSPPCTYFTRNP